MTPTANDLLERYGPQAISRAADRAVGAETEEDQARWMGVFHELNGTVSVPLRKPKPRDVWLVKRHTRRRIKRLV